MEELWRGRSPSPEDVNGPGVARSLCTEACNQSLVASGEVCHLLTYSPYFEITMAKAAPYFQKNDD